MINALLWVAERRWLPQGIRQRALLFAYYLDTRS